MVTVDSWWLVFPVTFWMIVVTVQILKIRGIQTPKIIFAFFFAFWGLGLIHFTAGFFRSPESMPPICVISAHQCHTLVVPSDLDLSPKPQIHLPFGCCVCTVMWKPKMSLNFEKKFSSPGPYIMVHGEWACFPPRRNPRPAGLLLFTSPRRVQLTSTTWCRRVKLRWTPAGQN